MKLSEADRLEIADRLLQSLQGPHHPDADHAWALEIERPLTAIDNRQTHFVSWHQVPPRIA